MEIQDCAGRFHGVTDSIGTSRKTVVDEPLVFVHQSLELTFWRGDGVEALDVEETQPLDIYRSTILGSAVASDYTTDRPTENVPCPSYGRIADNIYRLRPSP